MDSSSNVVPLRPRPTETRIVYGTLCTWWDSIDKVGKLVVPARNPSDPPLSLPCCPHCQGMLYELDSIESWFANVEKHQANGHEGYRDFIVWMRGRCFPGAGPAKLAYEAETGKTFTL